MRDIANRYRGLSLLFEVNCDRLLFPGVIALALFAAGHVAAL